MSVEVVEETKNDIPQTDWAAEEAAPRIRDQLRKYISEQFKLFRTISLSQFFVISNWPAGLEMIVSKSPQLLSLLLLIVLIFRGPLDQLLSWVFGLSATNVLAAGPILLACSSLYVHFDHAKRARRENYVRKWILQLTVIHGWTRDQFIEMLTDELRNIDYAYFVDSVKKIASRDASSLGRLMMDLKMRLDRRGEEETRRATAGSSAAEFLIAKLSAGDFARKIQALASVGKEDGFKPTLLAIQPFHLLISNKGIEWSVLGLLRDATPKAIDEAHKFGEGMTALGLLLGLFLDTVILLPSLVWTFILSWSFGPILVAVNVAACCVTLWVLLIRPAVTVSLRRGIPRGLGLHECVGAFSVICCTKTARAEVQGDARRSAVQNS